MHKIEIRRTDGSLYWAEHAGTKAELGKWLREEMTRPYWDKDFVVNWYDLTPPPPSKEQVEEQRQAKEKKQTALSDIKKLKSGDIKNIADIEAFLIKISQAL
jgi:hypothetical protein